jgi:hypothetical protein
MLTITSMINLKVISTHPSIHDFFNYLKIFLFLLSNQLTNCVSRLEGLTPLTPKIILSQLHPPHLAKVHVISVFQITAL